jgi:hypothetical protein
VSGVADDTQAKSAAAKESSGALSHSKKAQAWGPSNSAPTVTEIAYKTPSGFYVYMLYTFLTFVVAALVIFAPEYAPATLMAAQEKSHQLVPAFVAFGPIVFASLLMRLTGDRSDMRWPFHKVRFLGAPAHAHPYRHPYRECAAACMQR